MSAIWNASNEVATTIALSDARNAFRQAHQHVKEVRALARRSKDPQVVAYMRAAVAELHAARRHYRERLEAVDGTPG